MKIFVAICGDVGEECGEELKFYWAVG